MFDLGASAASEFILHKPNNYSQSIPSHLRFLAKEMSHYSSNDYSVIIVLSKTKKNFVQKEGR